MEYVILVLVFAAVFGYFVFRQKKEPQDTYVCAVCGEKDCVCHKVEKK